MKSKLQMNFISVPGIIRMCIILRLLSCNRGITKDPSLRTSVRMIILAIFAKVMACIFLVCATRRCGLISLVGGKERFAQKLDSMFTYNPSADEDLPIFSTGMIGQYAHGNEPSHHVIYLFNAIGQPWKTQKYAAEVMHELYKNTPAGLCGNEDCGQMSAWYVFSAMGFYPVDPISGKYEIGTPMYPEMKMHLANGKTFTILAPAVSKENIYIQSVKLDGKPYDKSYITHEQIMNGSIFEFEMGNKPGKVWYEIE